MTSENESLDFLHKTLDRRVFVKKGSVVGGCLVAEKILSSDSVFKVFGVEVASADGGEKQKESGEKTLEVGLTPEEEKKIEKFSNLIQEMEWEQMAEKEFREEYLSMAAEAYMILFRSQKLSKDDLERNTTLFFTEQEYQNEVKSRDEGFDVRMGEEGRAYGKDILLNLEGQRNANEGRAFYNSEQTGQQLMSIPPGIYLTHRLYHEWGHRDIEYSVLYKDGAEMYSYAGINKGFKVELFNGFSGGYRLIEQENEDGSKSYDFSRRQFNEVLNDSVTTMRLKQLGAFASRDTRQLPK